MDTDRWRSDKERDVWQNSWEICRQNANPLQRKENSKLHMKIIWHAPTQPGWLG